MNTQQEAHTALPWRIRNAHVYGTLIEAGDGLLLAKMSGDSLDGDAHLIVTAVNHHAELVEALRGALTAAAMADAQGEDLDKARAILATIDQEAAE